MEINSKPSSSLLVSVRAQESSQREPGAGVIILRSWTQLCEVMCYGNEKLQLDH